MPITSMLAPDLNSTLTGLFGLDETTALPLLQFEEISSTNQMLWEQLGQGDKPPIAAIAIQQTAGRGQWGRHWQSEKGGLYLSLALAVDLTLESSPHLMLWSAWGIAERLRQLEIPVGLKWPNDLVLNYQKLGGIKCETKVLHQQIHQAVIGVGLNWENPVPPQGIALKSFLASQSSRALGFAAAERIATLEQLLTITLQGLHLGYTRYQQQGIESILPGYLEYFINLHQPIAIAGTSGIITGITAQGELKVQVRSQNAQSEMILPLGAIQLGYGEPSKDNL
ncbi:MAG: biotin--[acetyl-CoA-carboxylase] ligase [Merismopediaceae bacterium]|nr:biotin--[acetyl-CoA-carboxylase] ligase [Merismopediaceae bacterium]